MSKRKNTRGYKDREVNTTEVKQRFLIVCEGGKTEPNYFKSFRVPKNVVKVEGLGENPSRLVDSAKEFKDQDDYDQVWCVFDRDDWPPKDFNNAIKKAEYLEFKVAYSNEAFELWYVLHFEFLHTGIPRNDYCAKLDRSLGKKYQKNSETIYDELFEKQSFALKNAERLLSYYEHPNPGRDNPSTTVHRLVQELNRFIA